MSESPEDPAQVWTSRTYPVYEDIKFQRISWRVERGGWLTLCLFISLALLGFFSNGPVSSATATDAAGAIEIDYGRFQRYGAETSMQLHLSAVAGGEVAIRIGNSFVEAFKIEKISPQPVEERGSPDGVEMTFQAVGGGPFQVHLAVRPQRIGMVRSEMGVAGERPARFAQLVLP